jgi:hypothetical protein
MRSPSTFKGIVLLSMAGLGLFVGAISTTPAVASGEPRLKPEAQIAAPSAITETLFADNFNDGDLGSAWTQSDGTWATESILSQTSTAYGDLKKALISNSGVALPNDGITITAKVRVDYWVDGTGARAGVSLAQNSSGMGYNLVFRNNHSTVQFLHDHVAWGPSYTFEWSDGVWYWFKLKMEDGTLWGKVWQDGAPEPESWPYTWERSERGGYPGLNGGATRNGGVSMASFDDVTVTVPPCRIYLPSVLRQETSQ